MQRNEGIFASWIKIISYAAEVYARNSEGSGMFQYVGDDPQSILEQIDHDIAEGKIAALTPPETGYIIEYKRQLDLKNKINPAVWQQLYMGCDGEFTMYVDLVRGEYAASSTAERRTIVCDDIRKMFACVHWSLERTW